MRAAIRDGRASPVENLMRNPRFRRARPGTSIVRRNRATIPRATTAWDITIGTNGAATGSIENGLRKAVWTAAPTAGNARIGAGQNVSVIAGEVITVSLDVAAAGGASNLLVDMIDAGGTFVSLVTSPGVVQSSSTLAPSRVSVTFRVPLNVTRLRVYHRWTALGSAQPGAWLAAGNLLAEARGVALPFFDGATVDDSGFAYSYEGATNASESVARAQVTTVRTNLAGQPISDRATSTAGYGVANGATIAFVSGAEGIRVTAPAGGVKDSGVALTSGINNALVYAGRTYTYSVDVTGEVADSWRLSAQGAWASGAVTTSSGVTAIGVGETKRLWLTITPTANGVTALFLLRNDASIASQARIRRVLFEETTLVLPYFDGDTTPDADLAPSWLGTVGVSQAVLSGVTPAGATSNQGNRLSYLSLQYPGEWVVPTYAPNNDSFGQWTSDGIPDIALVRGKRVTMLGTLRTTATMAGASALARSFAMQIKIGNDFFIVNRSTGTQPPNTPGVYQVRMTFDVPAEATAWGFLRAFNGDQPSGAAVYWSNVAMVVGQYDGPVLDGDMPGCVWRGTPHDSPTVGYRLAA